MIESDEEEEDTMQYIIQRELLKTPLEKVEDHKRFNGNMQLVCKSVNSYIQCGIYILASTKKFVRYFLRENYKDAKMKKTKQSYCKMLDNTFS